MVVYLIGVCPYDGYIWRIRGTGADGEFFEGYHPPLSCPQCKRRFKDAVLVQEDNWKKVLKHYEFAPASGAHGTLIMFKREFAKYSEWKKYLTEKSKRKS